MKLNIFSFVFLFSAASLFSQQGSSVNRTFNQIFPQVNSEIRTQAFQQEGYISYSRSATSASLTGGSASGIPSQITNNVLNKNPGYFIESIKIIECNSSNLTMLDIYNAMGSIRNLKGITYDSYTRGQPTPLFEDATRIVSESRTTAVADPAPANIIPSSETIYVRLKDVNFGNTYYRGDISVIQNGLSYSLTNFRSITYYLVNVIGTGRFTAQLYIEPIREGILIYSLAGVDISNFAANRIDINSAIAKRLGVITTWASQEILSKVNR